MSSSKDVQYNLIYNLMFGLVSIYQGESSEISSLYNWNKIASSSSTGVISGMCSEWVRLLLLSIVSVDYTLRGAKLQDINLAVNFPIVSMASDFVMTAKKILRVLSFRMKMPMVDTLPKDIQ
jgi:hypothetical protein